MYQVTGLTCSIVYGMGLQPIMGVALWHKNVGHPWFTETPVILYQPFVSVHNAQFNSECYTNDKGSNKTCENNIIPPTNIQYVKIHERN
jgi:hypothetical protein